MKGAHLPPPGPAQPQKPRAPAFGDPAGCPQEGRLDEPERPTLCQRRESLSFTRRWAVTTPGPFLTWLRALSPQPAGKRLDLEAPIGGRNRLAAARPPRSPLEPFHPARAPRPLPEGSRPLANSASGARQAPGSPSATRASRSARPLGGRLPSCQPLQWHPAKPSPDFLSRHQACSGRARGPALRGWCRGHPARRPAKCKSVRPGLQQRLQRRPGTRRRWRRQPASRGGGRRREVEAGLPRAWRPGGLAGGRHCGCPAPRRGPARPPGPGMARPGARRARAAAGRRAPAASPRARRLARCLARCLDFPSPARAPRAAAAAAAAASSAPRPGALLARNHSTASA